MDDSQAGSWLCSQCRPRSQIWRLTPSTASFPILPTTSLPKALHTQMANLTLSPRGHNFTVPQSTHHGSPLMRLPIELQTQILNYVLITETSIIKRVDPSIIETITLLTHTVPNTTHPSKASNLDCSCGFVRTAMKTSLHLSIAQTCQHLYHLTASILYSMPGLEIYLTIFTRQSHSRHVTVRCEVRASFRHKLLGCLMSWSERTDAEPVMNRDLLDVVSRWKKARVVCEVPLVEGITMERFGGCFARSDGTGDAEGDVGMGGERLGEVIRGKEVEVKFTARRVQPAFNQGAVKGMIQIDEEVRGRYVKVIEKCEPAKIWVLESS